MKEDQPLDLDSGSELSESDSPDSLALDLIALEVTSLGLVTLNFDLFLGALVTLVVLVVTALDTAVSSSMEGFLEAALVTIFLGVRPVLLELLETLAMLVLMGYVGVSREKGNCCQMSRMKAQTFYFGSREKAL